MKFLFRTIFGAIFLSNMALAISACSLSDTGDQAETSSQSEDMMIKGELTYRERIALPPDATAVIRLEDISIADRAAPVLAETSIDLAGQQVPISFSLPVDRDALTARGRYSLRGVIRDATGALLWTTDTANLVDPAQNSVDLGTLMMVRTVSAAITKGETDGDAQHYQCGSARVESRVAGDQLNLSIDGDAYTLRQVPSASGAKYESVDDKQVMFWNKGDRAMLQIGDRSFPECQMLEPMKVASAEQLIGDEWVVEDIAGKGVIDNSRATLVFTGDGRISGSASCNNYSGAYNITDDKITIGPMAVTRKACPPALMNQEAAFLKIMNDIDRFTITDNGALVVSTTSGDTISARR